MDSPTKLIVVLPCHSLEDFPTHVIGQDAESLLANWTALWHPALIAKTQSKPTWISQDFVDQDLVGSIILSPTLCGRLPSEIEDAVEQGQADLIEGQVQRDQILSNPVLQNWLTDSDKFQLVDEFFALGYAYLQVQIMTRQLRYSTTLDENEFASRLLQAASAAQSESSKVIEQKLARCFDLLLEEKNNYYPTEPHLIDFVLVPPSGNLKNQLNVQHQFNISLHGNSFQNIQSRDAQTFDRLSELIKQQQLGFTISGRQELPTALISIESLARQISIAANWSRTWFGETATTYASFDHTITPQLPTVLDAAQFNSAFHNSFVGGKVPRTSAPVINWQGLDGTTLSALSVTPIDANASEGMLKLGLTIGEMLDSYHHAELLFVHWPDQVSQAFLDLIATEKYGAVLGRFKTLQQFNDSIFDSGFSDTFECEDYQFPVLENAWQRKIKDPISIWNQYWQSLRRAFGLKLAAIQLAMTGTDIPSEWWQRLEPLLNQIDEATANFSNQESTVAALIDLERQIHLRSFMNDQVVEADHDRLRILNPCNHTKSVSLGIQGELISSQIDALATQRISSLENRIAPRDPQIHLIETTDQPPLLRNEFFEVQLDHNTGGIKSINRQGKKENLLSQQLAMRSTQTVFEHGYPRQRSQYSVASGSGWEFKDYGKSKTIVATQGALTVQDRPIAEFRQTLAVLRGDNKIYLDIEIELKQPLTGPPWRNYLANRIAWPSEDATLWRSENEIADQVFQEKFSAPNFVEVRTQNSKLSLLPGGLPFHRRSHRRMLDTLLIVEHENRRRFQIALAVDAPTSAGAATSYLAPLFIAETEVDSTNNGWLFHLNCKNIVLVGIDPKLDAQGSVVGVTMRLQESEGRAGDLTISCPHRVSSAKRIDLLGESLFDLKTDRDAVHVGFLAFQFFQVAIHF